jgi:hypothetical protein
VGTTPSTDGAGRIEPLTGSLTANVGQEMLVKRLAELRGQKKAIETEEKQITGELKDELISSSAAILVGTNGIPILRLVFIDRLTVNRKELEAKYPEIFAECAKPSQVIQVKLA